MWDEVYEVREYAYSWFDSIFFLQTTRIWNACIMNIRNNIAMSWLPRCAIFVSDPISRLCQIDFFPRTCFYLDNFKTFFLHWILSFVNIRLLLIFFFIFIIFTYSFENIISKIFSVETCPTIIIIIIITILFTMDIIIIIVIIIIIIIITIPRIITIILILIVIIIRLWLKNIDITCIVHFF